MKSIVLFFALLLALLALPMLLPSGSGSRPDVASHPGSASLGPPWQIDRLPDGASRVFGLSLGQSTLAEARQRLGPDVQVALIVAPGESGSLEAYYESINPGGVKGKLILTLATGLAQREQMLARARKVDYMPSAARRVELGADDLLQADAAPIVAMVFIPAANLDESVVLQRFGTPAERLRSGEHKEHFLYPDQGLDLQLDARGKEVLQYVAPRDFARLRAPLASVPAR
ncbi:MAG: hypothetical protein Q7U32_06960 [Rhodocyclaceae bacterium]|nr:hypothetical protein [Rhodocyclaceae bacterium]